MTQLSQEQLAAPDQRLHDRGVSITQFLANDQTFSRVYNQD
jgi:hypothetical protein